MDEKKKGLPQGVVFAFGLSEIGALLVASIGTQYFPFYLTDILLIPAASVASVLLVTRVFDIVTILLSSVVEEKVVLKWGKCRSWVGLMCPLAAVIGVIQYTGIGGESKIKVLIACVCYVLFFGFFNFGRTAQMALLNTIGKTPEERAQLSARKAQFASVATVVFSMTFLPLLLLTSHAQTKTETTQRGFFLTVGTFMAFYLCMQMILFVASKPYDLPGTGTDEASKKLRLSGAEMAAQIFKNGPLILLLIAETAKSITQSLFTGYLVYYFKVVAEDLTIQPIFATIAAGFTLAGSIFIGQFLRKKLGKKGAYTLGWLVYICAMMCIRFIAKSNFWLMLAFAGIGNFFWAGIAACGPAMFGDCVEFGKQKTGKEARAFIMGLYTLPIKIGVWLLGGISAGLLAWIGYDATQAVTPALKAGMLNIITFGPATFACIGLICSLIYPLTEKKVAELMEANKAIE